MGRLLAGTSTTTLGNLPAPSRSLSRPPTCENRHVTSKTLRSECHLLRQNVILTNDISRLQTHESNSTCRPPWHGHTLPPRWSKACDPARSGGVYDHHYRVSYGPVLSGRCPALRSPQTSRGPPLA